MKREEIGNEFGRIMVIVPHQDDEILMCAGILYKAAQCRLPVTVVMVTNGDYGSDDDSIGRSRLKETLAGLSLLGIKENQVEFLGYADTGMLYDVSFLYRLYYEPDETKIYSSSCSEETYGLEEKPEFHWTNSGMHAPYNRKSLTEDLYQILLKYRPDRIFTTSEYDLHGDHCGLFLFIRDILNRMREEDGYHPVLYSGIVHSLAGDEHWPLRNAENKAFSCPVDFDKTSNLLWEERISFPVPECMKPGENKENQKARALEKHVTALKPDAVDFLFSFLKEEELFWNQSDKGGQYGSK